MKDIRVEATTGEPTADEFILARRAVADAPGERPLGVCGELELSRASIAALARAARGLSCIDSNDEDLLQHLADWLEHPDVVVTFSVPPSEGFVKFEEVDGDEAAALVGLLAAQNETVRILKNVSAQIAEFLSQQGARR